LREVECYLQKFQPIQLRDSKRTKVSENYNVMNFGEAKGLSFDRVLIFPTEPFINWLKDNNAELAETSRSKLYVAITRARHSVAIIYNNNFNIEGITNYNPNVQV
jgi:superfamily I DNA/RNA helicase